MDKENNNHDSVICGDKNLNKCNKEGYISDDSVHQKRMDRLKKSSIWDVYEAVQNMHDSSDE